MAVDRLDDCNHDREEQAGDGRGARGNGDRHVESAPVKPRGRSGNCGADTADVAASTWLSLLNRSGPMI